MCLFRVNTVWNTQCKAGGVCHRLRCLLKALSELNTLHIHVHQALVDFVFLSLLRCLEGLPGDLMLRSNSQVFWASRPRRQRPSYYSHLQGLSRYLHSEQLLEVDIVVSLRVGTTAPTVPHEGFGLLEVKTYHGPGDRSVPGQPPHYVDNNLLALSWQVWVFCWHPGSDTS